MGSSIAFGYNNLPIRKITIGSLTDGMTYCVGNKMGSMTIERISFNEEYWVKFQEKSWDIFVREGDDIYPWKKHVHGDQSVTIEFDLTSIKNAL